MRSLSVYGLVSALLWGVAAAAQTAPLSVRQDQQVVCDIGPPASVPAEAAAAGFTRCAANWDFSQPEYATLSNWFDCDGSNPNVIWHSGSAGVTFTNPCTTIHQKWDTTAGKKVMDFQWLKSYGNKPPGGQFNQVGGQTFNNWTGQPTLTFGNFYIETVNRMEGGPCYTCAQNSGGPNDVYLWAPGPGGILENDIQEFNIDSGGAASGNCGDGPPCPAGFVWTNWGPNKNAIPRGYSIFKYHSYGSLWTSDGQTSKYICLYIDDILQGQGCAKAGNVDGIYTTRAWILASGGSNAGTATQNIDFDVQYIRVWSCDAYKTSMCNGTTLATGANGLKYWH